MTDRTVFQSLFHQRSHSMPIEHSNNFLLNRDNTTILPESKSYNTDNIIPSPLKRFNSTLDQNPDFFSESKSILNILESENKSPVSIRLNCKLDRGFFRLNSQWTCYRRNYFQVSTSLNILNHSSKKKYILNQQPIKQFLIRLKACINDPLTENDFKESHWVQLTQMTAKRDKGPQREPPTVPITPSGDSNAFVTFERLQFRSATANNGKRGSTQQYFSLLFELLAELEDGTQHVINSCPSTHLIVRGRSPGHYNHPESTVKKPKKAKQSNICPPIKSHTTSESEPKPVLPFTMTPPEYNYPVLGVNNLNFHQQYMFEQSFVPHGRSHSANDPDYFARQFIRSYPRKPTLSFDIGDKSLREWQDQVAQQRAYRNHQEPTSPSTPTPRQIIPTHNLPLYSYPNWSTNL